MSNPTPHFCQYVAAEDTHIEETTYVNSCIKTDPKNLILPATPQIVSIAHLKPPPNLNTSEKDSFLRHPLPPTNPPHILLPQSRKKPPTPLTNMNTSPSPPPPRSPPPHLINSPSRKSALITAFPLLRVPRINTIHAIECHILKHYYMAHPFKNRSHFHASLWRKIIIEDLRIVPGSVVVDEGGEEEGVGEGGVELVQDGGVVGKVEVVDAVGGGEEFGGGGRVARAFWDRGQGGRF